MSRKQNNAKRHARKQKSLNHQTTYHENEMVKATNIATGEVKYYKNGKQASLGIGCSHVLVYRCLSPDDYAKTAKGWRLEYVPLYHGIIN